MLRVLHVIETLAPHEGGPPRVVAGLAVAQRAMGVDAQVICGDGDRLPEYLQYWEHHAPGFPNHGVHTITPGSNALPAKAVALRQWLRANLPDFDVVHIHHLWRLVPTCAARACRRMGVPYLIAPHTGLSPWALGQKKTKKMLARWLIWNRILQGAAAFHALNALEADEIRRCNGANGPPVVVVPNGVSLAEFSSTPVDAGVPPAFTPLLHSGNGHLPFILFLARLHAMKGPDLLLNAFALIAGEHVELQLVYAGPDFGMLHTLRRRVKELGLMDRVHFLGLVAGPERLWLLQNALCLSQPSRDEGFSLSILEAMASRCPVVISDRCKFPEVARESAGVIVPLSVPDISAALRSYTVDPVRRASDGRSARSLVERCYTWDTVSTQTCRMYELAIGNRRGSSIPGCEPN